MHARMPQHVGQTQGRPPTITLPPLGMETVSLGEFEDAQLLPHLSYKYTPALASADVATHETKQAMEDGAVRLVVHLQNFGSQPVEVTISED